MLHGEPSLPTFDPFCKLLLFCLVIFAYVLHLIVLLGVIVVSFCFAVLVSVKLLIYCFGYLLSLALLF